MREYDAAKDALHAPKPNDAQPFRDLLGDLDPIGTAAQDTLSSRLQAGTLDSARCALCLQPFSEPSIVRRSSVQETATTGLFARTSRVFLESSDAFTVQNNEKAAVHIPCSISSTLTASRNSRARRAKCHKGTTTKYPGSRLPTTV